MEYKIKKLPKSEVEIEITLNKEDWEKEINNAYEKNKGKYNIEGFRKGKAPRSIIEKRFGEGIFFEEAIDELFREHYAKALLELELEVIDSPAAEFSEIKKGEGFTATITVPCYPVVEVKDYKGVEIEKIVNEVKDEDVERDIEQLQKRNARVVLVEREAKEGDTVLFDYAGFVGEEQFEGGTAQHHRGRYNILCGMFAHQLCQFFLRHAPFGSKRRYDFIQFHRIISFLFFGFVPFGKDIVFVLFYF